ncbi:epiplakin-like [Pyxicephalus adspersus]|uniref:epiplakin-like n=1 Tax=Pyxicephalus adspersus TaxID=30357 RepID=UPI003B5CC9B5
MNQILSDPSDDTKGFFDPNTHENLTYLQLLQRCIQDSETGLYLLDVKDSSQEELRIRSVLQSKSVQVSVGKFQGKAVSVWDLLFSQYILAEKRDELLKKYRAGTLTIEELITILITIIPETEKGGKEEKQLSEMKKSFMSVKVDISIGDLQEKSMSLWDLLHSKYIPEDKRQELIEKFKSGTLTIEEIINIVLSMIKTTESQSEKTVIVKEEVQSVPDEAEHWPLEDQVQKALQVIPTDLSRKPSEAGNVSLWESLHSQSLPEEKRSMLLQTYKSSVREVISVCTNIVKGIATEGSSTETTIIDEAKQKILQNATTEVLVGHFKGQKVSAWDLLNSKYLTAEKKNDLLVGYQSGTMTVQEIIKIITMIIEETEERLRNLNFKGLRRQVTATELLSSEIIDQKTLNELTQGSKTLEEVTQMGKVKRYLEGTGSIAAVFVPSKKDPSKKEKMSIYQAMWKQILRPGTALVLLEAQAATGFIIDPMNNKKLSVDEAVSAGIIGKELHAKLLSAERAVTGYKDPFTGEKISLFQAMKKNLIVKEHGIRLLEAQIATGGIIDPVHSHRVPVDVAYKRGYFDEEMNHVLSDPSDDTKGFFDPNTHENLTYLQLLKRCVLDPETGLCMLDVKDSRSPLFKIDQALQKSLQHHTIEIKTGQYKGQTFSIWELLSSYHLADVEKERQGLLAKYKSKSITLEELTGKLLSLVEDLEKQRAAQSFEISSASQEATQSKRRVETQNFLQSVEVDVKVGHQEGKKSSLWELLQSSYIPGERRNALIEGYESGALGLQDLMKSIMQILMEAEKTSVHISSQQKVTLKTEQLSIETIPEPVIKSLQVFTVSNSSTELTGENISLWDLLQSKNITKAERLDLLQKYLVTIEGIVTTLTGSMSKTVPMVTEKTDTATFLKSVRVQVNIGEFKLEGQPHSLWELLHSKYITEEKKKELIQKYESGTITWEQMFNIITTIIKETEEKTLNIKFKA